MSSGSVHGGPGAEAASSQAELHPFQPASSGSPGTSPQQPDSPHKPSKRRQGSGLSFFYFNSSQCLPLLSAETGEEERGGAEEEAVGGRRAGEDPEQITSL